MAVGKGSMARASKAAAKKTQTTIENNAEVKAADRKEETMVSGGECEKSTELKSAEKRTAAKKTTIKKTTPKKEDKAAVSSLIVATSEQVMKEIVYQSSSQVLNRDAMENETFGIGEAMPIYLF